MNVAGLVDAYNHGVTRVKKDRDTPYATLQMAEVGGQAMSVDTARQLCASLGVVEMYCNPFEELNNLNKYIKEFVKFKNLPQVYANTQVDFMNRRGDLPGSSYNRVAVLHMWFMTHLQIMQLVNTEHLVKQLRASLVRLTNLTIKIKTLKA